MKKTVSVALSVIIVISGISVGLGCLGSYVCKTAESRRLNEFWSQISEFDGDIDKRLIVKSSKEIDCRNAVCTASGYDNTYYLQFDTEEDLQSALDYYRTVDFVEEVQRDTVMQTDSYEGELDAKCYAAANSNIDDALKLINTEFTDLPEIKVAVIDTGTENNQLFGDRLVGGYDSLDDEDYHGSYVAGTILYNTPDNVKIYSYKAGSGTSISTVSAATAVEKAVSDGCRIINMSFGSEDFEIVLYKAILKAYNEDTVLVASAGNKGKNLSAVEQYPAEYSEVLAVGNMTASRTLASTSNYGSGVFTYATGTSVRACYRGSDVYWSGTSAASPIVASVIADILTVNPDMNYSDVKECITDTAMSPNEDNTSRDIIDAYGALKYACAKELPAAELEYTVTKNSETGYSNITFSCDGDTRIYYYLSTSGSAVYPIDSENFSYNYRYADGSEISLDNNYVVNAVAYSDTKAKSILYHIVAPQYDGNDYKYTSSSKSLSLCRLNDKEITAPERFNNSAVKKIGAYCYAGNKNAEIIVLPECITEIGEYAFANCPNLKKIIALGVKKCGRYAFQNCSNLKEVIMPLNSKTYTGMFKNCISLIISQISETNYYTSYYNKAFYGCENLVNYNSLDFSFFFKRFGLNGRMLYSYSQDSRYIVKSADEILFLWDSYYINKETPKSDFDTLRRFDSTSLFDVNYDGIVNAKDYAAIKKAAEANEPLYE